MFDSGHLTLVSGAGEGEVVSKKVGKEVRGAQGSRGGPVSRERHRYHTHAGTQGAREEQYSGILCKPFSSVTIDGEVFFNEYCV